jgi:hypothetical protein
LVTTDPEVTVTGPAYWSARLEQLAPILRNSAAPTIRDLCGQHPTADDILQITHPQEWAADQAALRDALLFAVGTTATAPSSESRVASGVATPAEQRLMSRCQMGAPTCRSALLRDGGGCHYAPAIRADALNCG